MKKILRILGLIILILLAFSGVGIIGAFFSDRKDRYLNREVKIEMIDKNKTENESEISDQIKVKN